MGTMQNCFTAFFALCAALVSHYFGVIDLNFLQTPETKLSSALKRYETANEYLYSRVAVGFDASNVLVANLLPLVSSFLDKPPKEASDVWTTLTTDLMNNFNNDSAGVILLDDNDLASILSVLKTDSSSYWSIEGVAFVFARELEHRTKQDIVFGAKVTDSIGKSLQSVKVPALCQENPIEAFESFHVALEWSGSDHLRTGALSEVPRKGNRVSIFPRQPSFNKECIKDFFEESENCDLVVIGGLHRLQNLQPRSKFIINEIAQYLKSKHKYFTIHLELGSIQDMELAEYLAEHLFSLCDSIGFGEDNFLVLNHAIRGPHLEVKVGASIAVAGGVGIVNDIVLHIFATYGQARAGAPSRLSRVFFSSYAFQVTALIPNKWSNVLTSVSKASQKVASVACPNNFQLAEGRLAMPTYFTLSRSDSAIVANVDVYNPITQWRRKDVDLHIVPVLLCNQPKRSTDIGIAASAEALKFIHLKKG